MKRPITLIVMNVPVFVQVINTVAFQNSRHHEESFSVHIEYCVDNAVACFLSSLMSTME